MSQAQNLVQESMSPGVKEVLWEIGGKEPSFNLEEDYLELYRGTSAPHFEEEMGENFYGEDRKLHFTLDKEGYTGAEGFSQNHEGEPIIVTARIPWDKVAGALSNSGQISYKNKDIEPGKIYFDEPENWIGYNLPKTWIETESI